LRQNDNWAYFALCLLSVRLHEDIIVILCPVSLSVLWDIRVIRVVWGFYFIRGFGFLWFFAVIILLLRFEKEVCLSLVLDSIV
jgi:hypothetical protein